MGLGEKILSKSFLKTLGTKKKVDDGSRMGAKKGKINIRGNCNSGKKNSAANGV